jgi:AraC-like DNA-binding protein
MPNSGTIEGLGAYFGLNDAPVLLSQTLHKTSIAVTQLRCDAPGLGRSEPIPADDAFLVALQVRAYPAHDFWVSGKAIVAGPYAAGETIVYGDVRTDPIASLDHPFHSIFFYLPRAAIDAIADGEDVRRIDTLRADAKAGRDDAVVRHLAMALLPAFENPAQADRLFVDHVTSALAIHAARTYGEMRRPAPIRGGLAPWQDRRAKELLNERLDGTVVLAEIAEECGLSPSHFARSFRKSTGMPPHRWLMQRRLERAKSLLLASTLSLSEIGLACGFADQSHFTTAFTKAVGASPGAWRRARRG